MVDAGARLHLADLVHAEELRTRVMLARLLREPLLHFLLLGGVLFAVFGRGGSDAGVADRQIVVSAADIDRLAAAFSRTWHRPPAADELQAQIQDYIREEVLYRTALALGLDKDDTIIRRRLRQKMEFLFEDTVPPPQEAELRAYFQAHADKFRTQPLISFRQVFVSQSRGAAAEADARQILARLVSAAPGAADEGDALLLGEGFSRTPLDRIAALFGDDFAQALAQAGPGTGSARCDRPTGCTWSWSQPSNRRRCRHSSRCGRRWSGSGSPSAAPRRRRPSIKPCSPATRSSSRCRRRRRHDARCRPARPARGAAAAGCTVCARTRCGRASWSCARPPRTSS